MKIIPRECSICTAPIEVHHNDWYAGHNAWPINDGRCCDGCNIHVVVPFRVALMNDAKIGKTLVEEDGSIKKEIVDEYISSGC